MASISDVWIANAAAASANPSQTSITRKPATGRPKGRPSSGKDFSKKPHKKRRAKFGEVSSKLRTNKKKGGGSFGGTMSGHGDRRRSQSPSFVSSYKILDEDENRIVNPLLQIAVKPHHLASLNKLKPTALGAGNSQSPASSGHSSSRKDPTNGSELLVPMELVFHKGDTYPLSYLARLLGFDVPVPSLTVPTGKDAKDDGEQNNGIGNNPSAPQLPIFPTPIPDPGKLPFVHDRAGYKDPFLQVPQITFDYRKLQRNVCSVGDRDDQVTLDYIDPVYQALLVGGPKRNFEAMKATASSWAHKFAAIQEEGSQSRHKIVLDATRKILQGTEWLASLNDWTFHDWSTVKKSRASNPTTAPPPAAPVSTDNTSGADGKNDSSSALNPPSQTTSVGIGSLASTAGTPASSGPASDSHPSLTPPQPPQPQWTIDGNKVFHSPTPQSFGVLAKFKGRPVALLKWRFMWYQLPTSPATDGTSNKSGFVASSATITKKKQEAELVIWIDGIDDLQQEQKPHWTRRRESPKDALGASADATGDQLQPQAEATNADILPTEGGDDVEGSNRDPLSGGDCVMAAHSSNEASSSGVKGMNNEPGGSDSISARIELNPTVRVIMTALALEHARSCDVWYGLVRESNQLSVDLYEKFFRMVSLGNLDNKHGERRGATLTSKAQFENGKSHTLLVCDMKKCSSRYALLQVKQGDTPSTKRDEEVQQSCLSIAHPTCHRERCLVRMPDTDQAKMWLKKQTYSLAAKPAGSTDRIFTSVTGHKRQVAFGVRIDLGKHRGMNDSGASAEGEKPSRELIRLKGDGTIDETAGNLWDEKRSSEQLAKIDQDIKEEPQHLDILRHFPLPPSVVENDMGNKLAKTLDLSPRESETDDEILATLAKKQEELVSMERAMEPRLRELLSKVVEERVEYEKPESIQRRAEEKRLLEENEKIVARRKELDLAWQKQLEQDMDAVCQVCADGEVTPDNQILFCEACNVAVHQMCYGIAVVPEGDYYCMACRYFKRESMTEVIARMMKRDGPVPTRKITPPPLPICCELCPRKQGAYIRSDYKSLPKPKLRGGKVDNDDPTNERAAEPQAKWVHMVCAKWQGLNFVDETQEVVEDVTELKTYFRRMEVRCDICRGQRGAYNKCRFEGCDKWLHISCARDTGLCEVVHGEDVAGKIEHNPWTLLCREHTERPPIEYVEDKEFASVDLLIQEAKELPPEPVPPPLPVARRPFNKLTGDERKALLQQPDYEEEVLIELTKKRLAGARCEVCDTCDETGFSSMRCNSCSSIVCVSCRVPTTDEEAELNYTCSGCTIAAAMEEDAKSADSLDDKRNPPEPNCCLCLQKGGLLLESFGHPVCKQVYWRKNPKEFTKTLFAKPLWCHILCAL